MADLPLSIVLVPADAEVLNGEGCGHRPPLAFQRWKADTWLGWSPGLQREWELNGTLYLRRRALVLVWRGQALHAGCHHATDYVGKFGWLGAVLSRAGGFGMPSAPESPGWLRLVDRVEAEGVGELLVVNEVRDG